MAAARKAKKATTSRRKPAAAKSTQSKKTQSKAAKGKAKAKTARTPKRAARKKKSIQPPEKRPSELESANSRLGQKWACFRCGAKFYDLNKPEPLCPRCETDQRTRPITPRPAPPPKRPRKAERPLTALLDDEDVSVEPESIGDSGLEIPLDDFDDDGDDDLDDLGEDED